MAGYDLYVFILCLVVFVLLAGLSTLLLSEICKLTIKTIKHGLEDDKIKEEYFKTQEKKNKNKGLDFILSLFLCLFLCVVFAFSLYVNCTENSFSYDVPTMSVVRSASMSRKHEKNKYLTFNNLNDQFDTFDIILTYKAPSQEELKLYDIVVYEADGKLIVHRIVGIEEPTETKHPGERWFLCQGDANEVSDRFPVKYEQIKGIYKGERIRFVGSFVLFMQSPAGWLCIILVVIAIIAVPILENKFEKETNQRLLVLGLITEDDLDEKGKLIRRKKVKDDA